MRQILAAIKHRNYMEERKSKLLISWQTRNLATFIAGGYMVDGKNGNPALDIAQKIAIDEIESKILEEAAAEVKAAPPDPKPGSYEKFMAQFGR